MSRPEFVHAPEEADVLELELSVVRSRVDLSPLPELSRALTEQVISATGDPSYATDLVCLEPALEAAVAALAAGAPVIADGAMAVAGLRGLQCLNGQNVICKSGDSLTARLARTAGIALAAAAVRLALAEAGPGAIWVVGTEPLAVGEILTRKAEPALVIAMPAGFTAAVAAKQDLRASGLPSVTNISAKGGPAAAVAGCAALLEHAVSRSQATAR